MKGKKKFTLLLSASALSMALMLPGADTSYAVSGNDFNVNTGWTMSDDITTEFTVKNGNRAFSTGEASIDDIGVTATFVKQADRNKGASYLSANGNNQAAYGATSDMLYGNPDPGSIPALGMNTQPSNGCGGPLGSWGKYNADGEYEVGSVTFKFDRKVTDPILDLSGLGGYVSRVGTYAYNGRMILVGMGSFNSTNLHLATEGITLEPLTSNSNLTADNNIIQVKDRNTYTRAVVDNDGYNWIQFKDDYGNQYNINSPYLVPAGTGSVKLKGTFDKVTFKLYHQATPYSKFSREEYGTHSSYFANYAGQDPSHGDGINGMNVINTESVHIGGQWFKGDQNWDLFRASLRLQKPSSIGDKVWLDGNKDGIQDPKEKPATGVTVRLLDKEGKHVTDFNGNPVEDQVTDKNGNYKFENLAAGDYIVEIVPKDGQKLTIKGDGTNATADSDFDITTNKTEPIKLDPNKHLTNIDAGLVKEDTYKVVYKFEPSNDGVTPKELPPKVLNQLPKPVEEKADGEKVDSPKSNAFTNVETEEGTWSFEKWDKDSVTIDKDTIGENREEEVTGYWKFTPKPKEYKVDYEFQPSKAEGTPDKLPEGVLKQLPEAKEKLADGKEVPSPKDFKAVKDEVNKGTWTFEAWDKETATIKGADEHVVGTWVFTKDEEPKPKEYKVTHEFKSGTEGKDLPEEVLALLPKDQEGKKDGNTVGPTQPTENKVEVSDGTWEFKRYDRDQSVITGKDEHFVGTWVFTPKEEPKPETGSVYVKYVDDKGNVLEEQSVVKKDAPVGEEYTTEQKTFDGYTFKEMDETSAPKEGKVTKEDQTVIYVYTKGKTPDPQEEKGNVYVKYVDDKGNILEKQSVVKKDAPVGEHYTTEQKTFNGYEFARMADDSAPANGEVQKGDQHVTYVYKKTEVTPPVKENGSVYVRYITEDGTTLEDYTPVKKDVPVGENYTTEQKTFDGYQFKGMSADSAGANGNVINGDLYVTYVYKLLETPEVDPEGEKGNVYVNYITVDGETLGNDVVKENAPIGEVYTTEQKTFDGYEFVRMGDGSADANGNVQEGDQYVTYVYKPIEIPQVKTGNVYVKYVTEDGEVLEAEKEVLVDSEVGTKYTTELKTFDGYEFTRMGDGSADANGNVVEGDLHVVYVYRKKSTPTPSTEKGNVFVKYITEDGAVLEAEKEVLVDAKVGTKYTTELKTFDGYEFTRMGDGSADANGNVQEGDQHVIYVYRPVQQKGYKVTHKFKSGTEGKELPKEVEALLPADQEGKKDGEKVTPTQPEKTEVPVKGGKWIFKNYDKETSTIDKKDANFVGTWVFEEDKTPDPAKEYKVTHEFKSGTEGKELPKEVLELLPANQTGKKDGEKVNPTQPEKTEVSVEGGKWVFKNYDKKDATIDKADEHFVGTWVFEENTKKPSVSIDNPSEPNTSTGTSSSGKATVVPRSTTVKKGNKAVKGNVRTGVGSSLGAIVTLAGSALALFKSKKRK